MKKYIHTVTLAVLVVGLICGNASAGSYTGKARTFDFSLEELATISGKGAGGNMGELTKFVFGTSAGDLLEKARSAGISGRLADTTLYISGEKIRIDMDVQGKRVSHLIRLDEEKIYNIVWAEKSYMEISLTQMRMMQSHAQTAISMLGMEGKMEGLPPEVRAQLEAAMGTSPSSNDPKEVRKTGEKRTINGMPCAEYRVDGSREKQQVWISDKYPELRAAFEAISEEFSGFRGMGDKEGNKELWQKIPTGWPVVMKTFDTAPAAKKPALDVVEMLSVEAKKLPADTFVIPEGFTKSDMMDMPRMMRGGGGPGGPK